MGTPTPVRLSDPGWSHAVLDFWYRELQPPAWFTRDADVDDRIRQRFGGLVDEVGGAAVDDEMMASHLVRSAKTALAAVLVLDQFPRNIWRGTPEAFARDPQALAVSLRAIGLGFDRLLRRNERPWGLTPPNRPAGASAAS